MARNYENLTELLLHNERAKHYYQGLPTPTQLALTHNKETICSMNDLRNFVDTVNRNQCN